MGAKKEPRPTLPERYRAFLDLSSVNEMIDDLEIAFEETQNEKVYRVLLTLKKAKEEFWDEEMFYRSD